MQQKRTIKKLLGGLLLLLGSYALLTVATVAQQPPEPSSASGEDGQQEAGSTDTPSEPAITPSANQPFEDYEASEQISEDLSVAFPVDI